MKLLLEKLISGEKLSTSEAREALVNIANEKYPATQVASFITVYVMRPISCEELAGFRDAMLELCLKAELPAANAIDLCGTGGDGKNTFNISTLSAFVVAGAGYRVIKHGNYGVSSLCGSSNVLEHVGYKFMTNNSILNKQLEKCNLTFLHAPLFHPTMGTVAPIRKQLGVKTFFNMLGPLANPVQPEYQIAGVFNLQLQRTYVELLRNTRKRFAVLYAVDGYDEISLTAPCKAITSQGELVLTHDDFRSNPVKAESISGGSTVKESAKIFTNILAGNGTTAQNNVVVANAAMAIQCFCPDKTLTDCVLEAEESLTNRKALNTLKLLINLN